MGEVTNELLAKQMQAGFAAIQGEVAVIRADIIATKNTVTAVAGTLVAIQRDIAHGQRELTSLNSRIGVLVVTSDDHAHRLDQIDTRLERIEKTLQLTHV